MNASSPARSGGWASTFGPDLAAAQAGSRRRAAPQLLVRVARALGVEPEFFAEYREWRVSRRSWQPVASRTALRARRRPALRPETVRVSVSVAASAQLRARA